MRSWPSPPVPAALYAIIAVSGAVVLLLGALREPVQARDIVVGLGFLLGGVVGRLIGGRSDHVRSTPRAAAAGGPRR